MPSIKHDLANQNIKEAHHAITHFYFYTVELPLLYTHEL